MDNTAAFGRFVGWAGIVCGLAAMAIGLIIGGAEQTLAQFQECEAGRRLGLRSAPCPLPDGGNRILLIGAGLSSIASGVFFLLLSGILTVLVQIQSEQAEDRRGRQRVTTTVAPSAPAAERFIHPAAATAPVKTPPDFPTRFAMQQRYGEALGNRAHALLYNAAKRGEAMTEEEAVRAARGEQVG
jgi:hypothetical protein